MRRLDQLRADKICTERRESLRSKDFPRRAGLYAKVASRQAQISLRSWSSLESLEEIRVPTYRWENRMKGDFLKREGEFHNV